MSNMLQRLLTPKRKQKMTMLKSLLISIKKPKRRPTTKTPSLKLEDKFLSKVSSLMVDKLENWLLTKQIQLQFQLQLPLPLLQKKKKRKKLYFKIQKIHINQRQSP